MINGVFFRLLACLTVFSFSIYSYLDKQNSCTELKMHLPKLTKEIQAINEVNANLQYQIECFENPQNLLAMASSPEYAHLKFPFTEEVLTVKEGLALQYSTPKEKKGSQAKSKTPIVATQ
ncbi:MAG TPA: hypothetical protein VIJ14_08355 [Rhabdochlamydiaceae bacterium]